MIIYIYIHIYIIIYIYIYMYTLLVLTYPIGFKWAIILPLLLSFLGRNSCWSLHRRINGYSDQEGRWQGNIIVLFIDDRVHQTICININGILSKANDIVFGLVPPSAAYGVSGMSQALFFVFRHAFSKRVRLSTFIDIVHFLIFWKTPNRRGM